MHSRRSIRCRRLLDHFKLFMSVRFCTCSNMLIETRDCYTKYDVNNVRVISLSILNSVGMEFGYVAVPVTGVVPSEHIPETKP